MKAKKGFNLRNVCGENIIVAEGEENIDISMNESSAYLWKNIQGKEFSHEDLAKLLTDEYEVDKETALKDVKTLAGLWLEAGIIEVS